MKRVTITLEFKDDDAEYVDKYSGGCDIGLLLRHALGEFEALRQPAKAYVAKRYPEMRRPQDYAFKIRYVEKRNRMAEVLRRADVTILVADETDLS